MDEQPDLFAQPPRRRRPTTQDEQITRVRNAIGDCVFAFCEKIGIDAQFHAEDLHHYVKNRHGGAPASADRILRLLRREGQLDYVVVDRADSLYRVTSLGGGNP